MKPITDLKPLNDANRLGIDYAAERNRLPWSGPLYDVHTHLHGLDAAALFFSIAADFGVRQVWAMTGLDDAQALVETYGERIELIAVPNYRDRDNPRTFTTQFLEDMDRFVELGASICKFWAAPRGRDVNPALRLDHPVRRDQMAKADALGMSFMVHVADPDTWFATKYADHRRYGTKLEQYEPFEQMLDDYAHVPTIAAHMGGMPEDIDFLFGLLRRHPNLSLDTSATKWQVRELSRHPHRLAELCRAFPGRILFGTDIVATSANISFDLYASRYWALRTLFETGYDGPSPIVDPDLHLVDPTRDVKSTATLRGADLDPATLADVYHDAAARWMAEAKLRQARVRGVGSPADGENPTNAGDEKQTQPALAGS